MPIFAKRPLEISAVQFLEEQIEVEDKKGKKSYHPGFTVDRAEDQWATDATAVADGSSEVAPVTITEDADGNPVFEVQTAEGTMTGKLGDYLIKGIEGELYPCSKSVFETTYDQV